MTGAPVRQRAHIFQAFLHGFTGAGLFRRLDYPGAPAEFIDSRSVQELVAAGEFYQVANAQRGDANQSEGQSEVARIRTAR
jgi:hypothetical protein